MTRGIVAGGNFIVDYVKTVDVYPAEQALANIRSEYVGSGGAPYNVLLGLAKLGIGCPLRAIGRIGDDPSGRYILEDCQAHQIDTTALEVTPGVSTSYTLVVVVEGSGKRTFFHQRGANALLSPGDFDFSDRAWWHLHLGYLLLLDHLDTEDAEYGTQAARVLAKAKAAGLTVSIDLVSEDSDRFKALVPPALKYADLVFMNEFEASRLSGIPLVENGVFKKERVVKACTALETKANVVLHWAEGAAACAEDGSMVWQGSVQIPQEQIKSVAGSGDAFAAGFLLGHIRGDTTPECLKLGVCAAAASVMGYTCTDAILSEADCLALGERYGFRTI